MTGRANTCSASNELANHITLSQRFELACMRYAHEGGTSYAIACAALAAIGPRPMLAPVDRNTALVRDEFGAGPALHVRDRRGYELVVYREHVPHSDGRAWAGPAYWRGWETRVDAEGNEWTRKVGTLITDDFGCLVPVTACDEGGAA